MSFDPTGLVFALTAGVFTFFSPCSYSLLPAYMLYYLGEDLPRRGAVHRGLMSALGVVSVFLVLGLMTSYLGLLLSNVRLVEISGLILVVMGLITLFDLHLPRLRLSIVAPRRKDFLGLFVFGAAYGLASVGCSLAIFLSVVAYALSTQSFLGGFLSIVSYSLGLGVPMVLMAIIAASLREFMSKRFVSATYWIRRIVGVALVAIGISLLFGWYFTPSD